MFAGAETPPKGVKAVRFFDLIGETPLVDLTSLADPKVDGVKIYAKCEFMNPGYSIKDRIARNIIDQAEESGKLRAGMTVVAASSGNTGASVAMICAMRGYDCIITTSKKCSAEKMNSIKAYGATLVVSPSGVAPDSPEHYMNIPAKLMADDPETYFDIDQYDNLKNPEGHYKSLGPEIWEQTAGTITHFMAAASTGGTMSGVGKYLKEKSADVKVVLPDPVGSIFKDYFEKGTHGPAKPFLVEGVGKDSVPGAMDISLVDGIIEVTDEQAFQMCHRLARTEGLFCGGSSGLNVHAAVTLANQLDEPAVIVTVLCDTGIKYLTKVYNPDYLRAKEISIEHEGFWSRPKSTERSPGAASPAKVADRDGEAPAAKRSKF